MIRGFSRLGSPFAGRGAEILVSLSAVPAMWRFGFGVGVDAGCPASRLGMKGVPGIHRNLKADQSFDAAQVLALVGAAE